MECTGIGTTFQSRLLIIDRRGVSIMFGVFPDPQGVTLKGTRCLGIDLEIMETKRS
jgi:hypothetical protein